MSVLVPRERIEQTILLIRGHRVMLSTVLADLYAVEPRVLIQAVKRNRDRFPVDFMFQLTEQEFGNLKSQIVISSWGGLRRAYPYAFTEQGVAMLSSVLRSKRAIQVNIAIMRAFVQLREMIASNKGLARASMSWRRSTMASFVSSSKPFVNSWQSQRQNPAASDSKPEGSKAAVLPAYGGGWHYVRDDIRSLEEQNGKVTTRRRHEKREEGKIGSGRLGCLVCEGVSRAVGSGCGPH